MRLLPLRTNLSETSASGIPFGVYTVGTERQQPMARLVGYSAGQLFFTLSGTGVFRPIGQDKWDILQERDMLYIPDRYPHEYRSSSEEPWHVGYVSFIEKQPGASGSFGYGREPVRLILGDMDRIIRLLEDIWSCSGPNYDIWRSNELLFAMMVEIRRQAEQAKPARVERAGGMPRYRDSVVDRAARFLHDHLHLHLSLSELASYVGYSPKQVVRLFKEVHGATPLQYLQKVRLETAAELLSRRTDMTIKQIAAHVGMEPIYFARLFQRVYGVPPSKFGNF